MDIRTYKAKNLRDALDLVRRDLGPDAAVLHTREITGGLMGLISRSRRIEVTASRSVHVPSRLPQRLQTPIEDPVPAQPPQEETPRSYTVPHLNSEAVAPPPAHLEPDYRQRFRLGASSQADQLHSMVEQLSLGGRVPSNRSAASDLPTALFHVYTDLIEQEISEELARELIESAVGTLSPQETNDPQAVKTQIMRLVDGQIQTSGAIRTTPGRCRTVALIGPTGVGKTTTVAKLAANFRLRERRQVGLITVDTYRIAAVEQLKTYAEIIDLPMDVVSTPREMREAAARMAHLDLILLDTAGRSPRDEVQLQELKAMLAEAKPDEVHLVLSAIAGAKHLGLAAQRFSRVGTTRLLLTKLDEATGLGNLLPLLRESKLPVSYLTNGQNVPDDIVVGQASDIARRMLGGDRPVELGI